MGLLLASSLIGCHAQTPAPDAKLDRKIELLVRSQLGVPPDWSIAIGARAPSDTSGYDNLTLLFSSAADPAHPQKLDFLLSKDNATLARLSRWDLTKTPEDTITTAGRPIRGADKAAVEIVNYDDLQCPYCAKMHAELFPETLDHYKGLVKIVYKDDPLVEIHPWALHAAVDANCLAGLNPSAYWNYVDYLHAHGEDISGPDHDPAKSAAMLDKIARDEGAHGNVNAGALNSCLTKQDESTVRSSMKEAEGLKIDGTPTLFVNGERVSGAQPVAVVWAAIDRALRADGVTPPANPPTPPAPASKPAGTL